MSPLDENEKISRTKYVLRTLSSPPELELQILLQIEIGPEFDFDFGN